MRHMNHIKKVMPLLLFLLLCVGLSSATIDLTMSKLRLVPVDYEAWSYASLGQFHVSNDYSNNRTIFTSDSIIGGSCKANTSTGENVTFNYTWYVNDAIYSSGNITGPGDNSDVNVANLTLTGMEDKIIMLGCAAGNSSEWSNSMNSSSARIIPPIKQYLFATNITTTQLGMTYQNGKLYFSYGKIDGLGNTYLTVSICSVSTMICQEKNINSISVYTTDIKALQSGNIVIAYKRASFAEAGIIICDSNAANCATKHTTDRVSAVDNDQRNPIRVTQLNNSNIAYVIKENNDVTAYTCNSTGGNCILGRAVFTLGTNMGGYEIIPKNTGGFIMTFGSSWFSRCMVAAFNSSGANLGQTALDSSTTSYHCTPLALPENGPIFYAGIRVESLTGLFIRGYNNDTETSTPVYPSGSAGYYNPYATQPAIKILNYNPTTGTSLILYAALSGPVIYEILELNNSQGTILDFQAGDRLNSSITPNPTYSDIKIEKTNTTAYIGFTNNDANGYIYAIQLFGTDISNIPTPTHHAGAGGSNSGWDLLNAPTPTLSIAPTTENKIPDIIKTITNHPAISITIGAILALTIWANKPIKRKRKNWNWRSPFGKWR